MISKIPPYSPDYRTSKGVEWGYRKEGQHGRKAELDILRYGEYHEDPL